MVLLKQKLEEGIVISQSGFSGEAGYEIYLRDATLYADDMWNAV